MVDFCNFRKNNPRDRKKNLRDRIGIFLFFKNITSQLKIKLIPMIMLNNKKNIFRN